MQLRGMITGPPCFDESFFQIFAVAVFTVFTVPVYISDNSSLTSLCTQRFSGVGLSVSFFKVTHIQRDPLHYSLIHQLFLSSFGLWLDRSQDSSNFGWAAWTPFFRSLKFKVPETPTWYFTDNLSNRQSWLFMVLLKLLMCWMSWRHFFFWDV